MRKASMILGIIGGVIAILIGLLAVSGGVMFRSVMPQMMETAEFSEAYNEQLPDDYPEGMMDPEDITNIAGSVYIGIGVAIMLAGLLGVVGGALVKKNNVVAGVLMLVGCAISLFTVFGFLAFLLMLLGGIFALVKDKSAPQAPNVPDMPSQGYEGV